MANIILICPNLSRKILVVLQFVTFQISPCNSVHWNLLDWFRLPAFVSSGKTETDARDSIQQFPQTDAQAKTTINGVQNQPSAIWQITAPRKQTIVPIYDVFSSRSRPSSTFSVPVGDTPDRLSKVTGANSPGQNSVSQVVTFNKASLRHLMSPRTPCRLRIQMERNFGCTTSLGCVCASFKVTFYLKDVEVYSNVREAFGKYIQRIHIGVFPGDIFRHCCGKTG